MKYIYKYTSPNGKSYIGQSTLSPEKRRENPYGRGYRGSPCFWNAIRHYGGLQNFTFEILEEGEELDLDALERKYIKRYNTLVPNGYNVSPGEQGKQLVKAVDQYNNKYEKIATFESITEAAKANGCNIAAIYNVLSGRCRQAFGSYWAYAGEKLKVNIKKKEKRKRVYQFDELGNFVKEFESTVNADRFYGFSMGSVAQCCNKNMKRRRIGHYIFTYEPELDFEYYRIPKQFNDHPDGSKT